MAVNDQHIEGIRYDSSTGLPSHNIPDKEKNARWVMAFGKAIYEQWMRYPYGGQGLHDRYAKWELNRAYAAGMQPEEQYMQRFEITKGPEGDSETAVNIDFRIAPVVSKYFNIARRLIQNRETYIEATPLDAESQRMIRKFQFGTMAKIVMKDFLKKFDELAGIKPHENPEIPQTIEELEIYMESGGYKTGLAMAMEKAIMLVFNLNDFEFRVKREAVKEILNTGWAAICTYTDSNDFIKVEALKAEDVVAPYFESDDAWNIPWVGRIRRYSLSELKQRAGDNFTPEEYEDIEQNHMYSRDSVPFFHGGLERQNLGKGNKQREVYVLEYYFYSDNHLNTKTKKTKSGNEITKRIKEMDGDWEAPKNNPKVKARRTNYRVVYQGNLIIGSNYVFDAGLMRHQPRQRNNLYDTQLPIHLICPNNYRMEVLSLTEQVIPWANLHQNAWLNLQNFVSSITPPGIAVFGRLLEGISDGRGGTYTKEQIIRLFRQTGILELNDFIELNEQFLAQIPIVQLPGGVGDGLQQLIELLMFSKSMLEQTVGFNEATSATTHGDRALVGLQQVQAAGTNNAMWYIYSAIDRLVEKVAKDLCGRIQSVAAADRHNIEGYIEAIGTTTMEMIRITADLDVGSFGISVRDRMNEEQKQMLMNYVDAQVRLRDTSNGARGIELEDAIRVMESPNLKQAWRILSMLKRKRLQEEMQRQQMIQEQEIEKINAAQQGEMKKIEAKTEADILKQNEVLAGKMEAKIAEIEANRQKEMEKLLVEMQGKMEEIERKIKGDAEAIRIKGQEERKTQAAAPKPIAD